MKTRFDKNGTMCIVILGGKVIFLKEFVYLGYAKAIHWISMSYYAWNWSKSLCAVGVVVLGGCGGGWVWCGDLNL